MNEYKKSEKAIYLYYMYEIRKKILELDAYINPTNTQDEARIQELLFQRANYDVKYALADEMCKDGFFDNIFTDPTPSEVAACNDKEKLDELIKANEAELSALEDDGAILPTFNFSKQWVSRIDHAAREYVKAASRVNQDFLRHEGDSFETMGVWLECYAKTFTDLSVVISNDATSCTEYDYQKQYDAKARISLDLDSALGLSDLGEKYDKVKESISFIEDSLAVNMIKLITTSTKSVIEARDKQVDTNLLNDQFGKDLSKTDLLLINDISARVKAEMQLKNSKLDPEKFSVIYNAITFTKLTLLSKDALNELQRRAGVEYPDIFSNNYSVNNKEYFNILFNAVKTLDGNHAWLETAPPMPRANGEVDDKWPNERHYGYANQNGYGFTLFSNVESREKVFNKIFIGPLNMGIHKPHMIQKSVVLDEDYPYIPCTSYPFPNGVDDKTCEELGEEDIIIVDVNGGTSGGSTNPLSIVGDMINNIFGSVYDRIRNYISDLLNLLF